MTTLGHALRILLASYFYPPSIGGVERQSHLLATGLAKRGHHVEVIAARLAGMSAHEVLDGVPIRRISPRRGSRWLMMSTYLAGAAAALVQARSRTDVLQVQQALHPAAALSVLARAMGLPVVVRNSGSGEFGAMQSMSRLPLGPLGLRLIARAATAVSLTAEMTLEMRSHGFSRIVEITNGVLIGPELAALDKQLARERLGLIGPTALYLGRLDEEKGVDLLLDAWKRVTHPTATLLVVGAGPRERTLRRSVEMDPQLRIRFLAPASDTSSFLAAADLFILPSRSEGTSNALLEAMACGVPVVASDVGGNRAVIVNSEVGRLVERSPSAFATAIQRLLGDPEATRRLGLAGRSHVVKHHSLERMLDCYEALYRKVSGIGT